MSLSPATKERIESIIQANRVVLFMKGSKEQPQCGFSAATISILSTLATDYATIDVLRDSDIREGIKAFSNWPTIPQLYINQEFIGGCDIVREMYNQGELHEVFGLDVPDRTAPTITVSEAAAALIRNAMQGDASLCVHLDIDGQWNHQFSLGHSAGHEIETHVSGLRFLTNIQTALRASGLNIDVVAGAKGENLSVSNPNMPNTVNQLPVMELKSWFDEGRDFQLIDVRTSEEVAIANLLQARLFDEAYFNEIHALPRNTPLVFLCHHGNRSQAAAEQFCSLGFSAIYNVMGGIDAWSRYIDPRIPTY